MTKFKAQNKFSATGGSAFGGKIQISNIKIESFCYLVFVLYAYFGFCALSFRFNMMKME